MLFRSVASGMVEAVEASAVAATRAGVGWNVRLDDGRVIAGAALVLAHGNQPPEPMRVGDGISPALFINNPWRDEAQAAIGRVAASRADALVMGTGLTMVDMVLSLDEVGHRGRIMALSRRGQVPRAHATYAPAPVDLAEVPLGDVLTLWRWLRARATTVGWRAAVDAMRPHSHAIWASFDADQRGRFLRHARPWWDVHRHRIAPEVSERLKAMIGEGRLEIVAGRIVRMDEQDGAVAVEIARRGRPSTSLGTNGSGVRNQRLFGVAFNCTGPLGAMGRTKDPLLRLMIDDGLVAVDDLGMGLAVDDASRAGDRLWALGPLTKGKYWEIVAVPDIRHQVAEVADDIAEELRS